MEVVLLEKIQNLGNLGDTVKVAPGYGRNFLIPGGHALPATKKNLVSFEERRAELEKHAAETLQQSQARADKLNQLAITIDANMSDEGKLYGSIGTREIVLAVEKAGQKIEKKEVLLPNGPIHHMGEYDIELLLHTDVIATIKLKVIAAKA